MDSLPDELVLSLLRGAGAWRVKDGRWFHAGFVCNRFRCMVNIDVSVCMTRALLDRTADDNGRCVSAALNVASTHGKTSVSKLLITNHGAKADANDSEALIRAAEEGHVEVVKLLMDPAVAGDKHYAKADASSSRALDRAASHGHVEVCKVLMDPVFAGEQHFAGAHNGATYQTALHSAACCGSVEVCKLFVRCNVAALGNHKSTYRADKAGLANALYGAALYGHADVCNLFLDEYDIEERQVTQALPAAVVAIRNSVATCKLLIDRGARVKSATMTAASHDGGVELYRLLIDNGGNVNACNGISLIRAVKRGDVELCKLLVDHGADVSFKSHGALQCAAKNGNAALCKLLADRM